MLNLAVTRNLPNFFMGNTSVIKIIKIKLRRQLTYPIHAHLLHVSGWRIWEDEEEDVPLGPSRSFRQSVQFIHERCVEVFVRNWLYEVQEETKKNPKYISASLPFFSSHSAFYLRLNRPFAFSQPNVLLYLHLQLKLQGAGSNPAPVIFFFTLLNLQIRLSASQRIFI